MSVFYMPVKVFDEPDAVLKNASLLAKFGKTALLVTGRHSAKSNGSYDDVCAALDSQQIAHVLLDEIEENPCVETIMKARDFGVENHADFVIGIGGGSAMDAAKAVALMIRHREEDAEYLYRDGASSDTVPVVAVPTTCGTGSEVTAVSVITVPEKHTKLSIKHKIFPQIALIDGKYLRTAPVSVIHNTAIDALTHMIESQINTKATDYSRMCSEAGLRLWSRSLPVLRGERSADDNDYRNMMRASMMAGMAIAQDGTTLPHGLSYQLTFRNHVPHGKAVGYFTAGYLSCAASDERDFILQTAGFSSLKDFQEVLLKACGPVIADDTVLEEAVDMLSSNQAKLAAAPFPCGRETLRRIAYYSKETGY